MSTTLLPQAFWFRLAVPCLKVAGVPKAAGKRLLDLPARCKLPQTAEFDGKTPWAQVSVGWNASGLAIAVEALGNLEGLGDPERPEGQYGFQLWLDTRDTRDVARATRFCQRFDARLTPGTGKAGLGVKVQPRPIARAIADPPAIDAAKIEARAERVKGGWRLEMFLPSAVLNGYDPETNRRLGFTYQVTDPERPDEVFGVGREFPLGENPSLWSTLELVDEG